MVKRTEQRNKSLSEKSSNSSKPTPKQHTCPFCRIVSSDVKFMKPHISQHIKEQVSITKVNQDVENSKISEPKKEEPTQAIKTEKVENKHSFEINVNAEDFVLTNIKEETKTPDESPNKPPKCIKVKFFTDPPSAKLPSKSHSILSKYKCPLCQCDQDDSGAHLLFSHGMLACGKDDRCSFFFSSMEGRRKHEKEDHHDSKDSAAAWKDTCGACQERMTDLCSLVEHRMDRHSLNTCTLCGIIMNGREHFAKHVKTHNIRNVDMYNLKPEYPVLEKMLSSAIGMFDQEDMSVECNLCPLKTENLDYAWKTVKVKEGGLKLLHHYEYAHKVKNPAPTILKLFDGSQFHYKTLKVESGGDNIGKRKKSGEEGWNKKKKVSRNDEDPDDPEEI